MKNFKDISALHGILLAAYKDGEGMPGRNTLIKALQEYLEFDENQARLYAWTVLSKNSNDSADWVSSNAYKIAGTWVNGNMSGSAGNLLVTKTETWQFNEDLTYQHKYESYEGYVSPFGGSYSKPSSSSESGIWAPPDELLDEISIVIISFSGRCRPIKIGGLGSTQTIPRFCKISGEMFTRQ